MCLILVTAWTDDVCLSLVTIIYSSSWTGVRQLHYKNAIYIYICTCGRNNEIVWMYNMLPWCLQYVIPHDRLSYMSRDPCLVTWQRQQTNLSVLVDRNGYHGSGWVPSIPNHFCVIMLYLLNHLHSCGRLFGRSFNKWSSVVFRAAVFCIWSLLQPTTCVQLAAAAPQRSTYCTRVVRGLGILN